MYKITETDYKEMSPELQALYEKLPNPGSDEVVGLFPDTKSGKAGVRTSDGFNANAYGKGMGIKAGQDNGEYGDSGSASRFFYCAKSSRSERNKGTEELDHGNNHATVKPIALMEYLVKLVTKENAVVLDPFTGSGSTLVACKNTNRNYIGMELDTEYIKIAEARLNV